MAGALPPHRVSTASRGSEDLELVARAASSHLLCPPRVLLAWLRSLGAVPAWLDQSFHLGFAFWILTAALLSVEEASKVRQEAP